MIPATPLSRHPADVPPGWQRDFAAAITDPAELAAVLNLPDAWVEPARRAATLFGLRVPRSFVERMRPGDPADPLLRQVLPVEAEWDRRSGFESDPLREAEVRRAPGLLQKYAHRALVITTGACAMHCRYCFRREFPYDLERGDTGRWHEAVAAIVGDPSLREVILSGGDPLSLSTSRLRALTDALRPATHLESLRLHTRNAIVLPSRVDAALLEWIDNLPWRVTVVLHANHPQELQGDALDAIARLRETGALLLNQAVLLRGVNDDAQVLATLSRRLHAHGVLPYYLHLLDRVNGTTHFEVPETRGVALVDALARELPGYLVPKLAREQPGAAAKTVIGAGITRDPGAPAPRSERSKASGSMNSTMGVDDRHVQPDSDGHSG